MHLREPVCLNFLVVGSAKAEVQLALPSPIYICEWLGLALPTKSIKALVLNQGDLFDCPTLSAWSFGFLL